MKNEILDDLFFEKNIHFTLEKDEDVIWEGRPLNKKTLMDWEIIPSRWEKRIQKIRTIMFFGIMIYALIGSYCLANSNEFFIFSLKILVVILLLFTLPIFMEKQQEIVTNYIFTSTRFIFQYDVGYKKITHFIPLKKINHVLIHKNHDNLKTGDISFKLKEEFEVDLNFYSYYDKKYDRPLVNNIENVGEVFTLLQQYISKSKKHEK